MKSASRLLSVVTLALTAGMVISCARTETVAEYPHEYFIDARKVEAKHTLNQCKTANMEVTKIDLVVGFGSASDKLSPAAEAQIQKVAAIIKSPNFVGNHIAIEGYTDGKGKASKNMKLSYHRAQMVAHALVADGVPANMLSVQGFGESNPIATNSTAAGRAANRRVTFMVSSEM